MVRPLCWGGNYRLFKHITTDAMLKPQGGLRDGRIEKQAKQCCLRVLFPQICCV